MKQHAILWLCAVYLMTSAAVGSMRLDIDEFSFVREPYEILGGDYTVGYLRAGELTSAIVVAFKSYYLYWQYRPLFSPIVSESDQRLFIEEERRFGYRNPAGREEVREAAYRERLIVPEPDRFYAHGAGKPLLPAITTIPSLALVALATRGGDDLLAYQFAYNYHPVFILVRLTPILAGLATLLLVHAIGSRLWGHGRGLMAASLFLVYPPTIMWFPNIHHDAYMVPFLLGSAYGLVRRRYLLAGVLYGLALASKNTAVFVAPVLVACAAWQAWRDSAADGPAARVAEWTRRVGRPLAVTGLVAFVTLLPFANPISYAREVLTPLTGREFDDRGLDVGEFMLVQQDGAASGGEAPSASGDAGADSETAAGQSPFGVRLLDQLRPNRIFSLLVVLGILAAGPRVRGDGMAFISFGCLLMMFPYVLVFGGGLHYRSLMFVPFFALLAARLTTVRWCAAAVGVLAAVDLVYLAEPIVRMPNRDPVSEQSLWDWLP